MDKSQSNTFFPNVDVSKMTIINWMVFVCSHVQQVRKGLLTLVVRTSLRLGSLCGPTQLCRSRSLSSTTDMSRDNADLGNYNYLNNNCSTSLSLSGLPANRDRIIMEMVLQKGQPLVVLIEQFFPALHGSSSVCRGGGGCWRPFWFRGVPVAGEVLGPLTLIPNP